MIFFRRLGSLIDKTHNLKQAISILFVTVFISNILGLLRNIVITNRVGVTYGSIAPLDHYYAAFVLPDLLYSILIVGALSSAILPLLVKIDTEGDQEKFWETFNILLSTGLTVIIFGLVLLYLTLPFLMARLFPGFTPAEVHQTVQLAQVMLLSPLFFTVSQISTSALQAKRVFLTPAVAPIIYNLAIIGGALLIPRYGLSILVLGVIVGAAGHFLLQIPSLLKVGWRYKFVLGFKNSEVQRVIRLMIPRTIALTSTQLLLVAFFRIASHFRDGSITTYRLTDDLQTAPVLLLANTLAMAILPDFARHFAKAEHEKFTELVGKSVRFLIFIFLPVTIFLLIFRYPIISLYIAMGHTISMAEMTLAVRTFSYFVISLFFQGAVLLLARAYFARSDTKRPTLYGVISIGVAWILAEIFARFTTLEVAGLALAFSIGSFLNALLLWGNLRLGWKELVLDSQKRANFWPIIGGGILVAVVFLVLRQTILATSDWLHLPTSTGYLVSIFLGLFGGGAFYIFWAKMFSLEQWQLIKPTKTSIET